MTISTPIADANALRIGGLDGLLFAGLFVTIAASGFVMSEPAPYDGLMALLIFAALVAGLRVQRGLGAMFVMVALVVAADAAASTLANNIDYSLKHSLVTVYLSASAVFFACLVAVAPDRTMAVLIPAQVIAGLATAGAAIAGIMAVHPLAGELFTEFGRAKGAFKDANVMAPFLMLPIIFGLDRLMTRSLRRSFHWVPILIVLVLAVFLSFSRGAWVHLIVSGATYFGFLLLTAPDTVSRARAVGLALAGGVALVFAITAVASIDGIGNLFAERASLAQSYDSGESGRFVGQLKALQLITEHPFGLGAGDFADLHGEEVHNVYLNHFANAGWIGGFSYLALVIATLVIGINTALRRSQFQSAAMVLVAVLAGVAVEGLVVDTDHWRHFYLIVGLIWGHAAAARAGRAAM